MDSELTFHLLQSYALRLWISRENYNELDDHHDCKKHEWCSPTLCSHHWEPEGDQRVHEPVGETSETLAFCSHAGWEYLAEIYPDDSALRERKESYIGHKKPNKPVSAGGTQKDDCYSRKCQCASDRSDEKESLPPQPVNDRHGNSHCDQIGKSDKHCLQVPRNSAESGLRKDVVQVVENRIDPRYLIEHTDRNCKKDRQPVLSLKKGLGALPVLNINGPDDVLHLTFYVLLPDENQD